MSGFRVEIDGDKALVADLGRASALAGLRARDAVREAADLVAERARAIVPVRRGQLRDSITAELIEQTEAEVGPENARGGGYGHIVEKGLAGRAPRPFLGPALDETEPDFARLIDQMSRGLL